MSSGENCELRLKNVGTANIEGKYSLAICIDSLNARAKKFHGTFDQVESGAIGDHWVIM